MSDIEYRYLLEWHSGMGGKVEYATLSFDFGIMCIRYNRQRFLSTGRVGKSTHFAIQIQMDQPPDIDLPTHYEKPMENRFLEPDDE